MGQIAVTRLTKSQIITIPSLAETPAASPIDTAMAEFRHKMRIRIGPMAKRQIVLRPPVPRNCENLYEQARKTLRPILDNIDNGNAPGNVPCGGSIPESVERALCMTALSAVIETTFHQVLGQDAEQSKATSLLPFFYKDLGGDWLSFIEAAKAISELALDGSSPALLQESAAVKSQFQSLCRPFLAVIANGEVPVLSKESSSL